MRLMQQTNIELALLLDSVILLVWRRVSLWAYLKVQSHTLFNLTK